MLSRLGSLPLRAQILGFNKPNLTSAISFEAERGYMNAFGRNMRFSSFLHSNLRKLCYRSSHNSAKKLLDEVISYGIASMSDRSEMLNKVSLLMGYSSLEDLIEQERVRRKAGTDLKEMFDEFDISLECRRFPSIILGNSSLIQLYDEQSEQVDLLLGSSCKGYLPGTMDKIWTEPDKVSESWSLLDLSPQNANLSSSKEEKLYVLPIDSLSKGLKAGGKSDATPSRKESDIETVSKSPQVAESHEFNFYSPINSVSGISSRHRQQLDKSGFHTLWKLLHHFPRTYADLRNAQGPIEDGHYLIFMGKVLSSRGIKAGSSFSFLEVVVGCGIASDEQAPDIERTIYLHLKKYFRGTRFTCLPFLRSLESKHKEGDLVYVSGKVKAMRMEDHYEMNEYTIDMLDEEAESNLQGQGRPYPVYPYKGSLTPSFFRDIILRALKVLPANVDPIPDDIRAEFGLANLYDAYWGIHKPLTLHEADLARKRFIFDEFFYLQLARLFQMLDACGTRIEKDSLLERYRKHELNSVPVDEWSSLTTKLLKSLPFSLTSSQLNATSEIIWDLKRPIPMNRLLQGDVGCGKTVVAFLACMEVIDAGFQAAFMVPTELLAIQHYELILSLLENFGEDHLKPSIALLTGSTSSKQSRLIREGLQCGDIVMVIGTQSLIAERVEFAALRIAVVDEQHRFGVIERGRFNSKLYSIPSNIRMSDSNLNRSTDDKTCMAPHVLAMSATPIPRTLALALYGDMSLTQITDLPPGRVAVETFTLVGNEVGLEKVYEMMHNELQTGGKVFLVYPIIEESEQLPQLHAATTDFSSISAKFEGYQCGLLHGRMKSDEKEEALRKFRCGDTNILLSTQVIEIGVDVPDASMMVVMNAERLGIAQLHQLRGRVGRGTRKSICIFVAATAGALDRLKVLENSSDGFFLANFDLLHRGPGNLLGKKQSGHLPEFPIARLEIDGNILQEAHLAALKILSASSDLESFPKLKAELSMRQPLCLLGD
ncbi:ATP-dependent DNA helicase homolog RECG, chloroplastic isoform X2 [Aristolochia californica]|uniref:ATP-dependent DNA helicase homolog RECG, chloroplastic isoform X2 n=1 Tax=Aristolochia californica TaxID=171875 RepID=UPI0035DE1513